MNRPLLASFGLAVLLSSLLGCERQPSGSTPTESETAGTPASFESLLGSAGIDFRHDATEGAFYIIEEMGPGAAFFDADGDGDVDAYLVQGGRVPGTDRGTARPNALFLNDGQGKFQLADGDSRGGDEGYGMGVAAADFDNDGDVDLYVTNVGRDTLLVNDGTGHFEDRTEAAGLGEAGYGATAAFADYDGDGLLDLYVTVYIPWSVDVEHPCLDPKGERDYCNPTAYPPGQDRLYRNLGGGKFQDVTATAGIDGATGYGLGVVGGDFDGDGRIDFFVANDHQPNFLWRNLGDGRFEDVGTERGCAYNADGRPEASMGVVCEDLDVDGDLDLFITHFYRETNTYYEWDAGGFSDRTSATGLASHGVLDTGFGTALFDLDHDGTSEILVANGAVLRNQNPIRPGHAYVERNALLHLDEAGRFHDWSDRLPETDDTAEMSRGVAFGDIDGDGDLDLLVANNRGPAELLRNDAPAKGQWLIVELEGRKANRQGIGAIITVERKSGSPIRRHLCPQASYQSSHEPIAHFGLGSEEGPVRVAVQWPGRLEREIWEGVEVGRRVRLEEGTGSKTETLALQKTSDPTTPRATREDIDHPSLEVWNAKVFQAIQNGQLSDAEAVLAQWLTVTESEVGPFHFAYTRGIVVDGILRRVRGKAAETEKLYSETLATHTEENASVALLNSELGAIKLKRGDATGARPHLEKALRIFNERLGAGSPMALNTGLRLAETLTALRKADEVLPLLTRQFDRWCLEGDLNSVSFIMLARKIGQIARRSNERSTGTRYLEKAAQRLDVAIADTEEAGALWHELGDDHNSLRDYNRAVNAFREALRIREQIHGRRHRDTAVTLSQLGNVEVTRGNVEIGELLIREALAFFTETVGEEDLYTVTSMRNLAHAMVQKKAYAEAARLYEKVLPVYTKALGADAGPTRQVRDNLEKARRAVSQQ